MARVSTTPCWAAGVAAGMTVCSFRRGGTGAGLVSVATKSGTNRARGDAFYTGRPAQFTSADAFGHTLDSTQNAFGFGYGSPLRKNRTFYFVSAEQDFVHAPYYVEFAPQAPGSAALPTAISAQQGELVERQSPTASFVRLDETLSAHNTLNAELGYNRVHSANAQPNDAGFTRTVRAASLAGSFGGHSLTSRLGLGSVLNSHAFNSATVAWSSDHRSRTPNSFAPEQFVNGFGALGGDADGVHRFTSRQLQLIRAAGTQPERSLRLRLADRPGEQQSATFPADVRDRQHALPRHGERA
jgi:hypothetical protein